MLEIHHHIPRDDLAIGVVWATGLETDAVPPPFNVALANLLDQRKQPLAEHEEQARKAARDILRNGRYKPTGRGKPASEYLLRTAAQDSAFPRINAPADINNYLSLKYVVPMSLWDLERAGATRYVFRLGRPEESYVFNPTGQTIELKDLVVGCRVNDETSDEPIVNPVKDCQATKTHAATTQVAACVYAPLAAYSVKDLEAIMATFAMWLQQCGTAVQAASGVVLPGEEKHIG